MSAAPDIFQVRLETTPRFAGTFAEAIEPLVGSVSWSADEDEDISVVAGYAYAQPNTDAVLLAVRATADALGLAVPEVRIERLAQRDWLAENRAAFPPISAGRFYVYDPEYNDTVPSGRVALRVPAGGAFGSGQHGSTKGCLLALDGLRGIPPGPILDMGCGSGILAIAAAKRWRRRVLAADIDAPSVAIAEANAEANGVASRTRCVVADGYRHPAIVGRRFALVFANILARPLTAMAGDLARHLAPGGIAILSGLIEQDGNWVGGRHRAHGLRPMRRRVVDGWLTLVMRKPDI